MLQTGQEDKVTQLHTVIGDHVWICENAVVNRVVKMTGKYKVGNCTVPVCL